MNPLMFFGILGLLGLFAFRFLLSWVFRLIFLFLALLGLGIWCYIAGIWPFEKNVIGLAELQQRYCEPANKPAECDCLVKIVNKDLHKRFSAEELKTLQKERMQWTYIFYKSVEANQEPIQQCLETHQIKDDPMHWIAHLLPGGHLLPEAPEKEKEKWEELDKRFE